MNEHEDCLGQAQDYFAGRLERPRAAAWEAHRDACPACRRVLERWPHAAAVPELRAGVLAALGLSRARSGLLGAWTLPAATLLALALLVSAFWRPERHWARLDSAYGDTCAVRMQGGHPCCAD